MHELPAEGPELDAIVARVQRQMSVSHGQQLFELGVGLMYEYAPKGVSYAADYHKIGQGFWRVLRADFYDWMCERHSLKPRDWVGELVDGNLRDLIVGLLTAVMARYSVSLGIAVPGVALVLKTGVVAFCRCPPEGPPDQSVTQILEKFSRRKS